MQHPPQAAEGEEEKEEEGLGVPPWWGSGYPLQFLVGCAALRLLWDFRFYPSRGYAILSLKSWESSK
jgi:hypothetical protein